MQISKIIEKNKNSIILIEILIPKENNQATRSIKGTGFIISKDGKFLTCAHVYKQIPENELPYLQALVPGKIDEKGIIHYERYKINVVKIDEKNDLALMQLVSDNKIEFKPISGFGNPETVEEGDEVIFIGYPLALELIIMGFGITMNTNRCIVSSIKRRGVDGSLDFFIVDTHVNNGSSGSPLFSKDTGKIIGIASARISSKITAPDGKIFDIPANMGICRPAKYIENLLK